jgi:hypothetical protein
LLQIVGAGRGCVGRRNRFGGGAFSHVRERVCQNRPRDTTNSLAAGNHKGSLDFQGPDQCWFRPMGLSTFTNSRLSLHRKLWGLPVARPSAAS